MTKASTDLNVGGEETKLQKWLPLVRSRANAFREKGVEADDLVQEGLIGLLSAIRSYDESRGASFETFAYICITNRMKSAVSSAVKRTETVSLDESQESPDVKADPQEIVLSDDVAERWLDAAVKKLSALEAKVLRLYLAGYSYSQIADAVNASGKTVDNALCRAKNKLRDVKF